MTYAIFWSGMLIRYFALVLLACSLIYCSPSRESVDVPSSDDTDVSESRNRHAMDDNTAPSSLQHTDSLTTFLEMERIIIDSARAYGLGPNLARFPLGDDVFFYLFEGPEYGLDCYPCESDVTAIKFVYENNQVDILEVIIDFPIGGAQRARFNEDIRIHPLDDSLALLYDVEQWQTKGYDGELHTFKVISTGRNSATSDPNYADLMLDVYYAAPWVGYGTCHNTVEVAGALVSRESCMMDYVINTDGSIDILEYGARESGKTLFVRSKNDFDELCDSFGFRDTCGCCGHQDYYIDWYRELSIEWFELLEPYSKSHHITFDGQSFNVDQIDSEYVGCYYFF